MEIKNLFAKRRLIKLLIMLFCTELFACVVAVLLFVYKPDRNAVGALVSVSLDVISILVIFMLVANLVLVRGNMIKTTKIFLGLMLATMLALFLDFLTWAYDGALSFYDGTFIYIITSLCMGAVLASIFVYYVSYYIEEMYGLSSIHKNAKFCYMLNTIAFIITFTLGVTQNAFDIIDGHYKTGELYEYVMILPILTVFYMAGCVIWNKKVIGLHDVIAVLGYIFIMIVGAVVEEFYSIGTTYVGITVADIFIFVMLQNKLLERYKRQKEKLDLRLSNQYEILKSMAGIYAYVNYVDLENMTVRRFNVLDDTDENIESIADNHTELNVILHDGIVSDMKEQFWEYTDLSTLSDRMKNEKLITSEFKHEIDGWLRAQYIRIGDVSDKEVKKVIYVIRNIDEEKKNIEMWIKRSNTDELTNFYNRHAYEEDIAKLKESELKDNFVYVSIDINSLKQANDTLGHDAGDELIIGASKCMKQCLGAYGKIYRTGGDEFVALIYADDNQLEDIKKDMIETANSWKGELNKSLAMSCGYVTKKDADGMTLHQIAVLADRRMYEDKSKYYKNKGIDRRGQRI